LEFYGIECFYLAAMHCILYFKIMLENMSFYTWLVIFYKKNLQAYELALILRWSLLNGRWCPHQLYMYYLQKSKYSAQKFGKKNLMMSQSHGIKTCGGIHFQKRTLVHLHNTRHGMLFFPTFLITNKKSLNIC